MTKKNFHPAEPEMVFVEGGTFTMGARIVNYHRPHEVTLTGYGIAKYPVTQKQWEMLMGTSIVQQRDTCRDAACHVSITDGDAACHVSTPDDGILGEGDDYPMYYVSWDEAQEFIRRLNAATGKCYRLPTEAEWEYAARGGAKSNGYQFSGSNDLNEVGWYYKNSEQSTHSVGAKKPNELGIYDMSGNVYEWCNDWYGEYSPEPQCDPAGALSGVERVVRGGSWRDDSSCAHVWKRNYRLMPPDDFFEDNIGFRLACSVHLDEMPVQFSAEHHKNKIVEDFMARIAGLMDNDDNEEAIVCCDDALTVAEKTKDIAEILENKAIAMEALQRFDEALEYRIELLLPKYEQPDLAWAYMAGCFIDAGGNDVKIQSLMGKAEKFLLDGDFEKAMRFYYAAIYIVFHFKYDDHATLVKQFARVPRVWWLLKKEEYNRYLEASARYLCFYINPKKAAEMPEQYNEMTVEDLIAFSFRLSAYNKNHKEAIVCCDYALKVVEKPEHIAEILNNKAFALEELKRWDEALECWLELLHPKYEQPDVVWVYMAYCFIDAGGFDIKIQSLLEKAKKHLLAGDLQKALIYCIAPLHVIPHLEGNDRMTLAKQFSDDFYSTMYPL